MLDPRPAAMPARWSGIGAILVPAGGRAAHRPRSAAAGRQAWPATGGQLPQGCARTGRCSGPAWPPTGMRPCRPAPEWLAKPTSTNLHALEGCPPRSAGTGARLSAQEIASTLTGHPPVPGRRTRPRDRAWAQLGSFTPRPCPFTTGHAELISAGPGRWRPLVNAGQPRAGSGRERGQATVSGPSQPAPSHGRYPRSPPSVSTPMACS
jgi:hypothetical protein